ncbi:unnamed protein product [Gongylonema pulchrum]|uniref:PK_Tyr_Ser-Thr domain-containing protein n=1 Tax=Gongylonema pulchrum TaxID=637853 RepID=A0A183EJ05_9BILA|nr:unnamed protein product [Gongylonema pulchrum]
MSFVKGGGKPEKPSFCPDEIFAIVERAWIYEPEERPRFADLLPELEALRGCPAYQVLLKYPSHGILLMILEDTPYPPSSTTLTVESNFELSFNSNISHGESGRSGSVRFDKSGWFSCAFCSCTMRKMHIDKRLSVCVCLYVRRASVLIFHLETYKSYRAETLGTGSTCTSGPPSPKWAVLPA